MHDNEQQQVSLSGAKIQWKVVKISGARHIDDHKRTDLPLRRGVQRRSCDVQLKTIVEAVKRQLCKQHSVNIKTAKR